MLFPSLLYGERAVVRKRCRQVSKKLLLGQKWSQIPFEEQRDSIELDCEYYTVKPWAVPRHEQGVHFYMLLDVVWSEFGPFFGKVGNDEWPKKAADEALEFLTDTAWGTFCLMGNGGSDILFLGPKETRRSRQGKFVKACVRHWSEMKEVDFGYPTFWRCIALRQVLTDAAVPSAELAGYKEPWWSRPEELLERYSVFTDALDDS